MRVTRFLALAATLSLAISPAVAAAASDADSLSLTAAPGKAAGGESASTYLLIGAGVVAVVLAAVAMGGHDSSPASA
jgi:hypothetical protein